MAEGETTKRRLEIAHVLFMDIVGYSKLITDEQSEALHELNQIVRNTEAARGAEAAGQLTILPTGDGMALVFTGSVEEPVECALEISHALRAQPSLPVRMGIHSGPVHHVKDANERDNIAGVGINIAQRVMDCGDAGHILVSKRVADDLAQQRRWQPYLHELGDVEVKHGVVVSLVNLYAETIGNPTPPARFGKGRGKNSRSGVGTSKGLSPLARSIFIVVGLLILLAIVSVIFAPAIMRTLQPRHLTAPPKIPALPSPSSFADTIKSEVAKKINDELQDALSRKKDAEAQQQDALSRKKNGAAESSLTSATIPEKSIAVLPFENLNHDPDTDYLCDGIPESINNSLSELPTLKVMSRSSVFHYKGKETDAQTVGRELKVKTVLTGRVRQHADALSVSVELINAQDDSQIWGQQYNRKLADVFAVQEEIANEVSEKLRVKLTGNERQQLAKRPTENLKAFQYYMQARSSIHRGARDDMLAAVRHCEDAIHEDSNYALAYAGLADAYAYLGARAYIAPIEGKRKAEEAARKALSLDDNLAEAHAALGQAKIYFTPSDFVLGDHELRRAIELSPSFAFAHLFLGLSLVRQGRLDEGLAEFLKARELDPLASDIARGVAIPYYLKRDYGKAFELLQQASDLGPPFSHTWEIGAYIQNGKIDEALARLDEAKRNRKDDPILIYSIGIAFAAQNKRAEALEAVKQLEAMSGPELAEAQYIARIYAALNDKEMALSWLERGLGTGAIGFFYKDDPMWDSIRSDARFGALMQKAFSGNQ
jgi:TolB-like protein/class 3 adenylate cyclase/Flp pilus assembly protein TadD